MNQPDGRPTGNFCVPAKQIVLIRMGREPTERMDLGADLYGRTMNTDFFASVDDRPAECAIGLEPGEHDIALGARKVVFEVMLDPSCITHPAG